MPHALPMPAQASQAASAVPSTAPAACPATEPSPREKARYRELAALLQSWPQEIADRSVDGLTHTVARLRRALRDERQRGVAGHWTYSVARHSALARHYAREVAALRSLTGTAAKPLEAAPAAVAKTSRTELRLANDRPVPIPARPPHPGRIRVLRLT